MTLSPVAQDFDTMKAGFLLERLRLTAWVLFGTRWLWFTREATYSNRC